MLKASLGTFEMQPQHFHACAAAHGFEKEAWDYGPNLKNSSRRATPKEWPRRQQRKQRSQSNCKSRLSLN